MADDEPQRDPPHFLAFMELYNVLVRCDWHDPVIKEHVRALEAHLSKHHDLYANKNIMACIKNARLHCKSGLVPHSF